MRYIRVVARVIPLVWLAASLSCAAADKSNCVADFLNGAERQCETREQRDEIGRALQDMLTVKPELLLKKRYRDYTMRSHKWNAINVMERYFVPEKTNHLEPECFLLSISSAAAHEAIKIQLAHLHEANWQ